MMDTPQLFITFLDELARTRGRTMAAFREVRLSKGLSEIENVVLAAVVGAPYPPTVSKIGRSLGHPRQVIQRAADALVERGFVATRDNPDHKRARLLVSTEAGMMLQSEENRHGLQLAAQLTRELDRALIEQAVNSLRIIREALEAHARSSGPTAEDEE